MPLSHPLTPLVAVHMTAAILATLTGPIALWARKGHRLTMQNLCLGACVVAGGFTLLPGRYLGQPVWGQWFGIV